MCQPSKCCRYCLLTYLKHFFSVFFLHFPKHCTTITSYTRGPGLAHSGIIFHLRLSDCKWWAKPCMLLLPAQTTESGGLFNWVLQHVSRVMVTCILYSVYPLCSVNITPFVQFVPTRRSESRSQQKRSKAFLAANSIQYEFNLPLPMGHFQPTSTFKCSGTDGQNHSDWNSFTQILTVFYLLLFWDTHTVFSFRNTRYQD